jgi:hypothetical protein
LRIHAYTSVLVSTPPYKRPRAGSRKEGRSDILV